MHRGDVQANKVKWSIAISEFLVAKWVFCYMHTDHRIIHILTYIHLYSILGGVSESWVMILSLNPPY